MKEIQQFVFRNKKIRRMLECYVLILLCFFLFYKSKSYLCYVIILISYICSMYYLCSFLYHMVPYAKKEMKEVILAEQMRLQEEHLMIIKDNQLRLERLKKQYSEETKGFKKLDNEKIYAYAETIRLTEINYCANKVIDALLHNKITVAKSKNIKVYTQVIAPDNIEISLLDLISLFSNLLDNAIEASEKSSKPYIILECYPIKNYLVIKIINSKLKSGKINLKNAISSKKDAANHGLGLQIIKNIVEKYEGDIQAFQKEGEVSIEIAVMNVKK